MNTASSRRSNAFGLGVVQDAPHDLGLRDGRLAPRPSALGLLELGAPAEADQTVALGDQLGAPQAQPHVVAPAQGGHRPDQLLLVTSPSVKQHQERIGIVRLILPGNESRLHQRAGP